MQVLAATGDYTAVDGRRDRSWPLKGTEYTTEYSQGWAGMRMSALPSGEARILSYRRIYRSNPWVWAAVNTIARGLAGIPLRTFSYGASGQHVPIRADLPKKKSGPITQGQKLDLLLGKPSPYVSRRRLVRRATVDSLVYGNALWIKEPDGYGGVKYLWNCPWREVSVLGGTDQPIVGYRIMGSGGQKVVAQEDVVHFGEGDPDAPIAPSPLEPLQWTIALEDAMSRHLVAYFQNSARPSGVLQMQTMPDDDELAIIREQIKQLYSGSENAGKPLITSGTWVPMTDSGSYSDLVELARLSREEVAAAYGIPPPIMGILDKAIKANVEELREQYLRDVLAPHGSMLSDEIQCQLVDANPAWAGYVVGFDMSERLLPDLEALATAFKELKRVYTMNELRRIVQLPDLDFEWADQPWMEPGSLPAGLAPQGATVNPDTTAGEEDESPVLPDDDEEDDA